MTATKPRPPEGGLQGGRFRTPALVISGILIATPSHAFPMSGIYVQTSPAVELNILDSVIQLTAMPFQGGLGLLDGHLRLPLRLVDRPFDWPIQFHGLVGAHIQGTTAPPWAAGINYGGRVSYFPVTPLGLHLQVTNTNWFMEAIGMSLRAELGAQWHFGKGLSLGVGYQLWGVSAPYQASLGALQQGAVFGLNWQLSEAFDF